MINFYAFQSISSRLRHTFFFLKIFVSMKQSARAKHEARGSKVTENARAKHETRGSEVTENASAKRETWESEATENVSAKREAQGSEATEKYFMKTSLIQHYQGNTVKDYQYS